MSEDLKQVLQQFQPFSPGDVAGVRVFFAPGRVNLIGEHTDYNGGHVFPAALDLGTWAIVRPRTDGVFRFASTGFPQVVSTPGTDLRFIREDDFANYPKGVIWVMNELGVSVSGADFFFHGNLPTGAGLSSSASVEMATATAVNALANANLTNERLAQISQQAENEFVGVNCGIMDQFAVGMGKRDCALSLDCATLDYRVVPLRMNGFRVVISNTNKRRTLADSKYNERRSECERALQILRNVRPELKHLAQVAPTDWLPLESQLSNPTLHKRARHVVFENHRAVAAVDVLSAGELHTFGQMMNESHVSLRDDYEVTGAELDALVEAAWSVDGCIGSRMTGAGFGGCTVSLVAADRVDVFQSVVAEHYTETTGLIPSFYVSNLGDGAREVTEEVRKVWQY